MSGTLYKQGMKGSWKLLLIFALILTMYVAVIITMFDPEQGSALAALAESMPEMMAIVGMVQTSATMLGFMSAYLYGFVLLVFPMVYSMLTAHRLVAKYVDRGSMAYLLAAPVPRRKVAFTQMKVLASGILFLVLYASAVQIVTSEALFPGELDIGKMLVLNLGLFCLHLFIGGVCFLASCIFNDAKYSVAFGAGIPALAFIIQMLANYGGDLEVAKYFTFLTLYRPDGIIAGEACAYWGMGILFAGALALYAAAILIFSKKDLHI